MRLRNLYAHLRWPAGLALESLTLFELAAVRWVPKSGCLSDC